MDVYIGSVSATCDALSDLINHVAISIAILHFSDKHCAQYFSSWSISILRIPSYLICESTCPSRAHQTACTSTTPAACTSATGAWDGLFLAIYWYATPSQNPVSVTRCPCFLFACCRVPVLGPLSVTELVRGSSPVGGRWRVERRGRLLLALHGLGAGWTRWYAMRCCTYSA